MPAARCTGASQVADKSWLGAVPTDVPLASLAADVDADRDGDAGGVHHFLLPAPGWGSSVEAKEATALAPDATTRLKKWRGAIKAKPTKAQVDALVELSHRVEALWRISLQRLRIADSEARRAIPIWGHDAPDASGTVQREEIERVLADPDGAYQRLRRVMDAWCALWFWPLTAPATTVDTPDGPRHVEPPTLDQWIAGLQALLGRSIEHSAGRNRPTGPTLASSIGWDALERRRTAGPAVRRSRPDRPRAGPAPLAAGHRAGRPAAGLLPLGARLRAGVRPSGGFDLQLGNPPWVRPTSDVDALLAEGDPWWALDAQTERIPGGRANARRLWPCRASRPCHRRYVRRSIATRELCRLESRSIRTSRVCSLTSIAASWSRRGGTARRAGMIGLIHPETHFTDEKAGTLREATYLAASPALAVRQRAAAIRDPAP